jgi:hypothetical protein
MKRLVIVLGLALAFLAGGVRAEEKAKSELEEIKGYKPGSDTTYNWVEGLKEGLDKMKEDKCPGMLYFYCPDDKKTAFFMEKHIFADAEFSPVGGKFITIKINSTDAKVFEEAQNLRMGFLSNCKGKTGVLFLAPTGKPIPPMIGPNKPGFKRAVTAVEKKFAAKESKGEGEGEKKEGKKEKEEKEEKKEEKKEKE